jgi:hypothetical protein
MKSIFLQDANSLIMKPDDLVYILDYIRTLFLMLKELPLMQGAIRLFGSSRMT